MLPKIAGRLARFSKHRDRFELAASAKHQLGQIEEDGLVIVDVADLKGAGHLRRTMSAPLM